MYSVIEEVAEIETTVTVVGVAHIIDGIVEGVVVIVEIDMFPEVEEVVVEGLEVVVEIVDVNFPIISNT